MAAALIHFRGTVWPDIAQSTSTDAAILGAAVAAFLCVVGVGYLTGTMTPPEDGINLTHVALVTVWGSYTLTTMFLLVTGAEMGDVLPHVVIGSAGSIGMAVAFVRARS